MSGFDLFKIVPLVFLAAGLYIAVSGVVGLVRYRGFLGRASRAEGEVVDLVERSSSSGYGSDYRRYVTQTPVVRFRPDFGEELTVEVTHGAARLGQRVEVAYAPDDPRDVRIARIPWLSYVVRIVFGLVFAAFAVGFLAFASVFDDFDAP